MKALHALGTPSACRLSEALIESRQFTQLIPANAPSTPQISLPSRSGHTALRLRFFWPNITYFGHGFSVCTSATAYSGTLFSSRWSAMEYRRCQLRCTKNAKCTFCENLPLKTLHSRLEVLEKESSVFLHRALEASTASRESATWGSDVELEAMESEQTGLAFSLPPSPEHVRANSPVEFAHEYLYPSPGARDIASFRLDDILLTAASDSEDFGPALADALPPSGQEVRPSAAYSELVDVLSRATEKLSLDWPDEPASLKRRNSTSGSLAARIPDLNGGSCHFSRLTNLVDSVEQGYTAIPVVEDTLASHLSPSWRLPGSPVYGLGSPWPAFPSPTTTQTSWPEAAQQICCFGSESFLTFESGWELRHRHKARPDRKSVSARLKHALLTQISHNHPSRFGVQKS